MTAPFQTTTTLTTTRSPVTQATVTPVYVDPYAQQKADMARSLADAKQHQLMLAARAQTLLAIDKIHPLWQVLPRAPYPPAGDTSGFPATGDVLLRLSPTDISTLQRSEPGKVTANRLAQATARTPKPSALLWIGLACLGAGLLLRNR